MNKPQYQAYCLAQANWWIASATTGHCKSRNLFKSINKVGDTPMSDEEKVANAMETAQTHLKNYWESCDE